MAVRIYAIAPSTEYVTAPDERKDNAFDEVVTLLTWDICPLIVLNYIDYPEHCWNCAECVCAGLAGAVGT